MNWFSKHVALSAVLAGASCVCLLGCNPPTAEHSGPSYAELLTVYNAELQSLDRLEGKRAEMVAKHEAALAPPVPDAAQSLDALLSSANEAVKQLDLEGVTDPNELLDRAVEQAEQTQELTSELLESVGAAATAELSDEELRKRAELTAQFERELATIDQQIAEQKVRVERAREARDAAEATP